MASQSLLMVLEAASVGKYIVAAIVAILVGFAVLLYASSSDLVKLKFFKFDAYSSLFSGGWSYAKAKKRARLAMKREGKRLSETSREKMPETAQHINRDIAVGALAIAIVLVVLLILGVV
jgi:hypothetical protein